MATIQEMISRIQALNQQTEQIATATVEQTKEDYLELNASQLAQGVDKNGDSITLDGNGYTPYTKDLKEKYGQGIGAITDHVTLYMTGAMYKSETLGVQGRDILLNFNTDYSDELLGRTGDTVLGLNADSREDYIHGPFISALKPQIEAIMKIPFI
jgi:hypothetical protein